MPAAEYRTAVDGTLRVSEGLKPAAEYRTAVDGTLLVSEVLECGQSINVVGLWKTLAFHSFRLEETLID